MRSTFVAGLGTRERVATIGECDLAARFRDAGSRLQGAVTATHDQDALSAVLLRVDQPVDDFGQVLACHVELAWRAAPADRQQYFRCPVFRE